MGIDVLKVFWSIKWCKAGGILSPYLFNVYMDELSSLLNKHRTGCYIGERIVNHLIYADDLVVIAPSGVGLQRLLDVCCEFGLSHDVKYNSLKSCVMCMWPRCQKLVAYVGDGTLTSGLFFGISIISQWEIFKCLLFHTCTTDQSVSFRILLVYGVLTKAGVFLDQWPKLRSIKVARGHQHLPVNILWLGRDIDAGQVVLHLSCPKTSTGMHFNLLKPI